MEGDTHVIPADPVALLSKGKLDPRLFDVTELVEAGYDDASMERLPLIVDHAGPHHAARPSRSVANCPR